MCKKNQSLATISFLLIFLLTQSVQGQKPRARDLGIPFNGTPGPLNAITDVAGVEVGHTTLISGVGELEVGKGPVRTGVTAILPRGKNGYHPVFAAWFSLNGDGEMTGTTWIEDSGFMQGPVMITNTLSVGIVHHAVINWGVQRGRIDGRFRYVATLPIVAETWDGYLNDIYGQHVKPEHVYEALNSAQSGPVPEGNVGGGTGMRLHGFKGGIGTASRVVEINDGKYTVGVLAQCNYGSMSRLRIAGVPVGREIAEIWRRTGQLHDSNDPAYADMSESGIAAGAATTQGDDVRDNTELDPQWFEAVNGESRMGSIIIVVATDAPVLSRQLKRIARRASLALGRMGSISGNGSGDIFIAFSTANAKADSRDRGLGSADITVLRNRQLNPLFEATIDATEESIVNALVAAETMEGVNGRKLRALPHDLVQEILARYGRLLKAGG